MWRRNLKLLAPLGLLLLSPLGLSASAQPDADGDGFSDQEERDAGTDPLDASDFPLFGLSPLLMSFALTAERGAEDPPAAVPSAPLTPPPLDSDGDGLADGVDLDDDNDGVPDLDDDLPLDPTASVDTDGDGIGDAQDPDRNGDGTLDQDAAATTATFILF